MGLTSGLWAGVGFESGGEIVFGLGQQMGVLFSVDDIVGHPMETRWCRFQQESATIGLGLGGSAGTNLVIGFNAATPADFDGGDEGIDFSLDLGWGKLDRYLRTMPELIELAGIARKFDSRWIAVADGMKMYEKDRYAMKTVAENVLKNVGGVASATQGQAVLVSFPLAGGGLRLSVKYKAESTTILSFGAMDFRTTPAAASQKSI